MSSQEELMKELEGKAGTVSSKDQQAFKLASTLMKLLDDESVPESLWWLDDEHFAVDPKHFQAQVLDPHFRGTKYASFLRTMHKMGFARISRSFALPKGVVAYSCLHFRKDKPQLLKDIKMNNSSKQAKAAKAAVKAASALDQANKAKAASTSGTTGSNVSANNDPKGGKAKNLAATRTTEISSTYLEEKRRRSSGSNHSAAAAVAQRLEAQSAIGVTGAPIGMGGLNPRLMGGTAAGAGRFFGSMGSMNSQQMQMNRLREIAMAEERVQLSMLAQAQMRAADYQRLMVGQTAASNMMKFRNNSGFNSMNSSTNGNPAPAKDSSKEKAGENKEYGRGTV